MRLVFNGSYLQLPQTGIATYCRNLLQQWQNLPNFVAYLPQDGGWEMIPGYRPIPKTNHLTRLGWNQWHWLTPRQPGDVVFHPVPESGWNWGSQVTMIHDVIPLRYPELFRRKVGYFRYWVPLSLAAAQQVVCNSEQTKRDVLEFYGLSPEKLTVIPLAYDTAHFYPQAVTATTPYLLYVGAHEPHKNIPVLIKAFRKLQRIWPGELWIGGRFDPRYTPALQAQAQGLAVRWLDYVPHSQLPNLYRGAVAFIFPSLYEGFGLPILEAMACGTPVISSASGSLPEVGGEAVAYFEAPSVDQLLHILQKVVEDNSYRANLATLGLARAQDFSWQQTAAQTLAICQQVAQ